MLVPAIVHHRMRKARFMHETVNRLLENGKPVPEAPLLPERKSSRCDLRAGIILIGA